MDETEETTLELHSNGKSSNIQVIPSGEGGDYPIPKIDFSFLISDDDPNQRLKTMEELGRACHDYGYFILVNHGVPDFVFDRVFEAISSFFKLTEEDKSEYVKKGPTDRIRWGMRSALGENREHLKVVVHPQHHFPAKPIHLSEALEAYFNRTRELVHTLARSISKCLECEERFIEKTFELESGFDLSSINLYPPSFESKSCVGLPGHSDPGFFVSLIQDLNGGLQVLSHHTGKWVDLNMPRNAIFILLGDHLEVLTNGKYKSHVHRVDLDNNKAKRISVATLHGPSLEAFVEPAPEFVNESHPPAYRGMSYKQSLEVDGHEVINVQSCIDQLRI